MKLNPQYGSEPLITLDGDPARIIEPLVRQRRRLAATLESFGGAEWNHPSRCAGWTVRDVIVHLHTTNTFWAASVDAGVQGRPTRFLADFDPVASPAQHVADAGPLPAHDVLTRFVESTEALASLVETLTLPQISGSVAEAPPGHVSISAVLHHALWDAWIHERDIALPLDMAPDVEVDEVTASLRYAAALGPALAVTRGEHLSGRLSVRAAHPDVRFDVVVDDRIEVTDAGRTEPVADLELVGDAVELLEALSVRMPLPTSAPPQWARMRDGLAVSFDSPAT